MQRIFFRSNGWSSLFATAGLTFVFILGQTSKPFALALTKREPRQTQDFKTSDLPELKLGVPVERELSGGEGHSYKVTIGADQYVDVVVDQKGIDVAVRLFGPDGRKLVEVDRSPAVGFESAFLVANTPGAYRFEVKSADGSAGAGKYALKISELRAATSRDRVRVNAQSAFEEATRLRDEQTAESRRKAVKKYEEALALWLEVDDKPGAAHTCVEIGVVYAQLSEPKLALDYYNRAVALWRLLGDRLSEASTLTSMGITYWRLGETQKALDHHNQALPLSRGVGDRRTEGLILSNIAVAYFSSGQPEKALDFFNQSLPLSRAVGNRRQEAIALNGIATTLSQLGDLDKALEIHKEVLPLRKALGDRRGESNTLHNIAVVYFQLGDLQAALRYYNEALSLKRIIGDRQGEAITVHAISSVYVRLGDLERGLEYAGQALNLSRAVEDRRQEAYELNTIGNIYNQLGQPKKALDHFEQSLSLRRAVGDRYGEAYTLTNLASSQVGLGNPEGALVTYQQSLQISREIGDILGQAATLYGIAYAQRKSGNGTQSRSQIESALEIIESTRTKVSSQEFRSSFFASYRTYYEFYIGLLMQMHKDEPAAGHDSSALEVSERSRARTLLESLNETTYGQIREGVDVSLLERERVVRHQLSLHSDRLTRLLSGKHTEEQELAQRKQVEALLGEYREVETQIRLKSPRFAALTQPQPLAAKDIQKLLDRDTLLIEYSLGDEKSYVWAITPTSVKGFELPSRATIEAAAERFTKAITENQNRNVPQQIEAGAALSDLILRPVAKEFGPKKLVVVGDGVLLHVPFSALPLPVANNLPRSTRAAKTYQPLIVQHEIVQLPSASVLAVVRRESASRTMPEKAIAVIADPVFQSGDPRVKTNVANGSNGKSTSEPKERSAWESGLENLQRLPYSRREADAIINLVADDQSFKAVDFAANRAAVLNDTLSQYRVIHFATHAMLNSAHPELSGIVVSLVDENGQPQNGFVRLYEIYNLRLSADLVVLSACRTALGKQIKGEGLIGLTRGFMYAGSPRVVVSLWEVNDEATAELMKRFYRAMFVERMRPAAALRSAQLSMSRSRWWNAPYYWAAFELQGEFR